MINEINVLFIGVRFRMKRYFKKVKAKKQNPFRYEKGFKVILVV
jgi:hypothetical protein